MQEITTIQGVPVAYTRASIPVTKCRLDPRNPRIQYVLGQQNHSIGDQEIDDIIWRKDSVKALKQSIMLNGGIREHIIVQESDDGFYDVREGNCRTVAARRLLKEYPKDTRFSCIPAMIFTTTLTEENLAVMLADMHVAGKISWEAYEQAKYVHDLHTRYGKPYEWLSTHLRMSKSKIKQYLGSYEATEEYLKKFPGESIRKFSRFHEALKKKVLRDKLQDPDFKETFYNWLKDDKLTKDGVRALPKILENPDAVHALNTYDFDAAYVIVVQNNPALKSSLFASIKAATENLKGASLEEMQTIKTDQKKVNMLQDIFQAVQDLASTSHIALNN